MTWLSNVRRREPIEAGFVVRRQSLVPVAGNGKRAEALLSARWPVRGIPTGPAADPRNLAALVTSHPDGVLVENEMGIVQFANAAIERLMQRAADEIVGQPSGMPQEFNDTDQVEVLRWDGTARLVEVHQAELIWDHHPARMLVLRDITARVEQEERYAEAQRFEAVRTAAARIADDLRDAITGLLGSSQLLHDAVEEGEDVSALARQLVEAAQYATKRTQQLAVFGRARAACRSTLDLDACLEDQQDRLRPLLHEGIRVRLELGAPGAHVRITSKDLDCLLSRLIANANEAMSGDGLLTVATRRVGRPEADGSESRWVVLSIRDTGEGMDAHVRRHCFEPYFSTKSDGPGRGMGLACVHGTVFHARGRIHVHSTPGVGSSFEVHLPEAEPPAAESAPDAAGEAPTGALAGRRVLLVEDEDEVRRLLEQVLRYEDAEVEAVCDGDAALARLMEGPAPDLLISDLRMPGASVQTLVKQLRTHRADALVLVLSGFAQDMDEVRSALDGVDVDFLQKPFRPSALLLLVQELIGE
jgi:signal transduction histidine kinase